MTYLKKEKYKWNIKTREGTKLNYLFTVEFEKRNNKEMRVLIFREVKINGKESRDSFSSHEFILRGKEANKKNASKKAEKYIHNTYEHAKRIE